MFVAGAGVAKMLEMLEAGQPLPPDPEYEGLATESSEEFMARMERLRHAYEAQFLDRKDWKVRMAAILFWLTLSLQVHDLPCTLI